MIEKLIKAKTPFAIMQYFVSPEFDKHNTKQVWEVLTYVQRKKANAGYVIAKYLKEKDKQFLKENKHLFTNPINNKYGAIYEYLDFKNHYELKLFRTAEIKEPNQNQKIIDTLKL